MRNVIVSILIVAAVGFFNPLSAASGAPFCILPEVHEAVEQASAVFVGEVSEITEPLSKDDKAPLPGRFYIIKFKVEKSWKGAKFFHEFSVLSALGSYESPTFSKGEKYLVFAEAFYINGVRQEGWTIVPACNRTQLLSRASEDLKRLGSTEQPLLDFRSRKKK